MKKYQFFIILFISSFFIQNTGLAKEEEVRDIYFPTNPDFNFQDTFGADRYKHFHEGTDIIGEQMAPLYAAVDGVISYITIPEASWGYHVVIRDANNYTYHYLHINNDTPGTDDGKGGLENAYVEDIKRGTKVKRGQLIAYMGDSGNAEDIAHHLHFEIRKADDSPINAYSSLMQALEDNNKKDLNLIPDDYTINDDKNLQVSSNKLCESGALIKMASSSALYYCGADSKRYVFPNEKIFYSWYQNFDSAQIIADDTMESIPLGGNVTYKPGQRMIKIQSSNKVYFVNQGAKLEWLNSSEKAQELYGTNWSSYIDDISVAWFMDYQIVENVISI